MNGQTPLQMAINRQDEPLIKMLKVLKNKYFLHVIISSLFKHFVNLYFTNLYFVNIFYQAKESPKDARLRVRSMSQKRIKSRTLSQVHLIKYLNSSQHLKISLD